MKKARGKATVDTVMILPRGPRVFFVVAKDEYKIHDQTVAHSIHEARRIKDDWVKNRYIVRNPV